MQTNVRGLRKEAAMVVVFCLIVPLSGAGFAGGTGESNSPYQIATAEQLVSIGSDPNLLDKHFVLIADIDLDPDAPGGRVFDRAVIAPISETADPNRVGLEARFSGVFDGGGHTISNLTIRGGHYLGLFGQVSGTVKNLTIADADVSGSGNNVGCLAGYSQGNVTQCHSSGVVGGGSLVGGLIGRTIQGRIVRCSSSVTVDAAGNSAGGLVGYSDVGRVDLCSSAGVVRGQSYVGGLIGWNYQGVVRHCYSTGAVNGSMDIGGLIGQNWTGYVTHCYSTGAVEGEQLVGGLAGDNSGSIATSYSSGTVVGVLRVGGLAGSNIIGIVRSYSTGSVQGNKSVGGLVGVSGPSGTTASFWDVETSGQAASPIGAGKTTIEMLSAATYRDAGWDFLGEEINGAQSIWWIVDGQDYPRLWWEPDEYQTQNEPGTGSTAILD
jgi:hypothetical protein